MTVTEGVVVLAFLTILYLCLGGIGFVWVFVVLNLVRVAVLDET